MTPAGEPKRLFAEFEHPTCDAWRRAAERSLKGQPLDKLSTGTYEGITLNPTYIWSDAPLSPHRESLPGFAPYVRGARPVRSRELPWEVGQEIRCALPEAVNRMLLQDLEQGQTALNIVLDGAGQLGLDPDSAPPEAVGHGGVSLVSIEDMNALFKALPVEKLPLNLFAGAAAVPVFALLIAHARSAGWDLARLSGCVAIDPLGALSRSGSLPRPLAIQFDEMARFTAFAALHAPGLRTIAIESDPYHNAGASAVDELAFALATGVDYLREMVARGVSVDDAAARCLFSFSVGTFFFMELAKLRAARSVWAQAVEAFGGGREARKMAIHARTSTRDMTLHDAHTNILRGATECFAAVLGGADSIHVSPFDELLGAPDAFSMRLARNTQLVLREENHAGRVVDAAGGSWYVEHLTDSIAEKAWKRFQEVEGQGGMGRAILCGMPGRCIEDTAMARQTDVATRKTAVIGTNFYANKKERIAPRATPEQRDKEHSGILAVLAAHRGSRDAGRAGSALKALREARGEAPVESLIAAALAGATIGEIGSALAAGVGPGPRVDPLPVRRTAGIYEELRSASARFMDRTGKRPEVYLATVGPLSRLRARIDFTVDFFEVGGFEVIVGGPADTAEQAALAACSAGCSIAVLCAADDDHAEAAPTFAAIMKEKRAEAKVILAGNPGDREARFRELGVDEFIHLRANNHAILSDLLKAMEG